MTNTPLEKPKLPASRRKTPLGKRSADLLKPPPVNKNRKIKSNKASEQKNNTTDPVANPEHPNDTPLANTMPTDQEDPHTTTTLVSTATTEDTPAISATADSTSTAQPADPSAATPTDPPVNNPANSTPGMSHRDSSEVIPPTAVQTTLTHLHSGTPTPAAPIDLTQLPQSEACSNMEMTEPTALDSATSNPIDPALNDHITNLSIADDPPLPALLTPATPATRKKSKAKQPTLPPQGSILKSSCCTHTPSPHDHCHKRIILDASVQLQADADKDRYAEFIYALSIIINNGRILDEHFVLTPMSPLSALPVWTQPKDVPSNMMELGRYVFISGTSWKFKNKGKSRQDNMVYFSFTVSTDCDPEALCRDLGMEWGCQTETGLR